MFLPFPQFVLAEKNKCPLKCPYFCLLSGIIKNIATQTFGSERERYVYPSGLIDKEVQREVFNMKALVTGASSGIGRDMARSLSRRGADLILVARRVDRLEQLKAELDTNVQVIGADLSQSQACFDLYDQIKNQGVDIVINNAGFGLFGAFDQTDLERELEMIDTNIRAVHILTKLFLRDFVKKDHGYLLNVASSAAFLPGPLLSTYYATKSYVLRLTEAVYEELRRRESHVGISVLCPGPVQTEFNDVADCRFSRICHSENAP